MKTSLNIGLLIVFAGFFFMSCKDDDYETIQSADKIKIDSVKIVNDTMSVFGVQSIRTYSTYSSHCEGFYGYDYVYTGEFFRDVTSYQYRTSGNCTATSYAGANQINFSPQKKGIYSFRFWAGNNSWITKTIVVE